MWQPREDYWNYIRKLLESSVNTNEKEKPDHSSISKVKELKGIVNILTFRSKLGN